MAQAVQTRCGECGQFLRRRLDVLDGAYDELSDAYNEAEYVSEWEEHDCQAAASMAPRAGEHDAWLASIGEVGPVELEEETDGLAAAALAPSLAESIRSISIHSEEAGSGNQESRLREAARGDSERAGAESSRRDGQGGHRDGLPARPADSRPGRRPAAPHRIRPAAWAGAGEQLDLGGSAGPGRERHPVRPAPYPTSAGAGRVRPAARLARDGAAAVPLRGVGRDRDRDPVRSLRGGLTAPAAPAARARRGGLRLSRLLRWLQDDDPRLTRPLERVARAVEWVERMYDT